MHFAVVVFVNDLFLLITKHWKLYNNKNPKMGCPPYHGVHLKYTFPRKQV